MKKLIYACDFETNENAEVWAWGGSLVDNVNVKGYGTSIESFFNWCSVCEKKLYFHNLAFDGQFIVSYLLQRGFVHDEEKEAGHFKTVIDNMGNWYELKFFVNDEKGKLICITIWDSYKLIPFSIRKIAKDFNLPIRKLEIDYKAYREAGAEKLTDEDKAYLFNDVDILAIALSQLFSLGFNKMTLTSAAYSNFKKSIGAKRFNRLYPALSFSCDYYCRKSLKGGIVWANEEHKQKELGSGYRLDFNSLYPYVEVAKPLPFGRPVPFEDFEDLNDDLYPLWIGTVQFCFDIKENHIPTISMKKNFYRFGTEKFLKSSNGEEVEMVLTSIDWELIKEQYDVYDVNFLGGVKFRSVTGVAKDFVMENMEVKKNNDGVFRFIAKANMNATIGRFSINPLRINKKPVLNKAGELGFVVETEEIKDEKGALHTVIKSSENDPVYLPYTAFVNAYGRKLIVEAAQSVGIEKVSYIDTDSLHIMGDIPQQLESMIDSKELGKLKIEASFVKAYVIGQKSYIELEEVTAEEYEKKTAEYMEYNNGKKDKLYYEEDGKYFHLDVKCSGLSERAKQGVTFDNFRKGTVLGGNLKRIRKKNGVVLEESYFTL